MPLGLQGGAPNRKGSTMAVNTDSHGSVEEPSAAAQVQAALDADATVEVIPEDEVASNPTAEQGSAAEPSAAAQKAMLDEQS